MDAPALANAIRESANQIGDCDVRDHGDLLRVLANIVIGKDVARAFGAPGDWGYNTPIGAALAKKGDD
jgi:hypothetical protein